MSAVNRGQWQQRTVGDVMMYNTPCGKRPQSIYDSAMTLLQTGLQTGDIMNLIVCDVNVLLLNIRWHSAQW